MKFIGESFFFQRNLGLFFVYCDGGGGGGKLNKN